MKLRKKHKHHNLQQAILYFVVAIAFFSYFIYSRDNISLTAGIIMLIVTSYWITKTIVGWRKK
jgi:hypothetical protein